MNTIENSSRGPPDYSLQCIAMHSIWPRFVDSVNIIGGIPTSKFSLKCTSCLISSSHFVDLNYD